MINDENKLIKDNKGNIHEVHESGIDGDGNKFNIVQKQAKQISDTIFQLESGKQVSGDAMEVCYEAYNPNNFRVVFQNNHPDPADHFRNPPIIVVEANNRAFIPHQYYLCWAEYIGNKGDVKIHQHFGENKFKGLTTQISPPEVRKKLY